MTPAEIANKWQMNRYKTPHSLEGMDNKEYFDLLTQDIKEVVDEQAILFGAWLVDRHYPTSKLTIMQWYELFLKK